MFAIEQDRRMQIVFLRVLFRVNHTEIRIYLHNIDGEIGVAAVDTIYFRRVAIADGAIVPVENQDRGDFVSSVERMANSASEILEREGRGFTCCGKTTGAAEENNGVN